MDLSASAERPSPEGTAAAALRDMVARLVLDTTNEGIWLIDAQARTTFVNRAAADLLGYAEKEMLGLHIFELMDEGRRPVARENLLRRQRGIEERHELTLRRKDGTLVWVIASVNPIYDRSGQYAGALALFGDLTAQKGRETALHAQVDNLQRRLEEKATYREPFRTAIVLGVLACVATIATTTAAMALLGSLRRRVGAIDPTIA